MCLRACMRMYVCMAVGMCLVCTCVHVSTCVCVNMVIAREVHVSGERGGSGREGNYARHLTHGLYLVLAAALPYGCHGTHPTERISESPKDKRVTGDEAIIQAKPLTSPNHRDLRLEYWKVCKPSSFTCPPLKWNLTESLNARHSAEKTSLDGVYFPESSSSLCRATLHLCH